MKISILADSLALPRCKEWYNEKSDVPYEHTYPYTLDRSLKEIYGERSPIIMERGMRARTIVDVGSDWWEMVQLRSPEVVIVHVGVVDCAPRLLLQKEHDFVDKIRPIKLRDKILDVLSKNRRKLITLFPNRVYVPFATFEERVHELVRLAETDGVKRLILVNIIKPTEALEFRSPGFRKNVDLYNSCLYKSSVGKASVSFVDLDKIIADHGGAEVLTTDGIHINSQGHALLADRLETLIKDVFQAEKSEA
jgi:acyl-CoA thioesterase I